jgi:hypothetical protein
MSKKSVTALIYHLHGFLDLVIIVGFVIVIFNNLTRNES